MAEAGVLLRRVVEGERAVPEPGLVVPAKDRHFNPVFCKEGVAERLCLGAGDAGQPHGVHARLELGRGSRGQDQAAGLGEPGSDISGECGVIPAECLTTVLAPPVDSCGGGEPCAWVVGARPVELLVEAAPPAMAGDGGPQGRVVIVARPEHR